MDRYELKEQLGDGSFGRVAKATSKETGEVVAIKQIKQKYKTWKACTDLREVRSLRSLSHPNIVPIREVIRERDESLYFVFDFMPGGSLYELTKAAVEDRKAGRPQRLTRQLAGSFVRQILQGLSYIHSRGYVHRDIKPENILVNGPTCKLADFGLAREVTKPALTFYVSTRWYRAPEVILHCAAYGKPIDIFATGLILAELFSLRPLFPGTSEIDQLNKMVQLLGPPMEETWAEGMKKLKRMNFNLSGPSQTKAGESALAIKRALPIDLNDVAARFIDLLIRWSPEKRPTADDALRHEFFRPSDASKSVEIEERSDMSGTKKILPGQKRQVLDKQCDLSKKGPVMGHHVAEVPIKVVDAEPKPSLEEENEFGEYIKAFSMRGQPEKVERCFQTFW
ncbi:hypothetical protein ACHAWF_012681 [Thalassiosira exigua]